MFKFSGFRESFKLGFSFVYMFYTFKLLPHLKIWRRLSLLGRLHVCLPRLPLAYSLLIGKALSGELSSTQTDLAEISVVQILLYYNPVALRKAKIVYNCGFSECNRVNQ